MSMTDAELNAIRADGLDDIVPLLPDMGDDDLRALLALEQADGKPRVGLVEPIEQLLAERDAAQAEAKPKRGGKSGKADAKTERAEIPDWQKPDYTGSLTADQAYWRNTKLVAKDADEVATK